MVDAELLDEGPFPVPPAISQRSLLSELLRHPLARVYRYRDEGPPPEVQPDPRVTQTNLYEGWAVVSDYDADSGTWSVIYRSADENYTLGGVMGNATDVAVNDTKTQAYAAMDPRDAADRRRTDALAANVADQALDADLYVTEREYLHRRLGRSPVGPRSARWRRH